MSFTTCPDFVTVRELIAIATRDIIFFCIQNVMMKLSQFNKDYFNK